MGGTCVTCRGPMSDIFLDLRKRIQEAEQDPSMQTLEASVSILRDWLDTHTESLLQKKGLGEYNGTMMQWFHWYTPNDGDHWNRLRQEAAHLAAIGITGLWLPPANKGSGGSNDVGYGTYDLFDLGEFDQKGSVRTKYGTKEEYLAAVKTCRDAGIQVYADVVFNHKMSADFEEDFEAVPYDPNNRTQALGDARTIRSWTGFRFPGRQQAYSTMDWHWWHFDSVDYNSLQPDVRAIWRMKDSGFESQVDMEKGNYDYLMGCDLNMSHPEVTGELKYWGEWILNLCQLDGFRLDAIKHINSSFFTDWIQHLEKHAGRNLFVVGEYWTYHLPALSWYAAHSGGQMCLFDAPLHLNFHTASKAGGTYDMRRILDGTLMKEMPLLAVTLVDNHDTQPLQALESPVEAWFKPLAYAIILLRQEGYPCIFHPDYYGASYSDKGRDGNTYSIELASHRKIIDILLQARRHVCYGPQIDYLDHFNTIGWTRHGSSDHPHAMAVLLSDSEAGSKWMDVARPHTRFRDLTGQIPETVTSNADGWAEFRCGGGSVSVWVEEAGIAAINAAGA